MAEKYFVFKVDDAAEKGVGELIPDAVVIREQDAFAPEVFYTYAAAAENVVEILEGIIRLLEENPDGDVVEMLTGHIDDLRVSGDFFRNRADAATLKHRKLPTP